MAKRSDFFGAKGVIVSLGLWLGFARAYSQTNLPIYTDHLVNGFQDWSWASRDLANGSPVHSGTSSIRVTASAGQAISFYEPIFDAWQGGFDPSVYSNLVFWAHGGASGGQVLQVYWQYGAQGTTGPAHRLAALQKNTWQQLVVPLSLIVPLGVTNVNRLNLQLTSSGTSGTFYLDDIELAAKAPPAAVHLEVNASRNLRKADARWFGVNTAIWDKYLDTSETIGLLKEMGTLALRFPGGSISDQYHWASNTTLTNTWTWSTPFAHFATVATSVGAQVILTVNYGTGTPEEAAAWVREANVNSHYAMQYWEIGNECYGTWETDSNAYPHDAYTYATRVQSYIQQMKAVDPTIRVGVVVVTGEDSNSNGYTSHAATNLLTGAVHYGWTPVLLSTLKSLGVRPDFAIYHEYPEYTTAGSVDCPESDPLVLQATSQWSGDAANLRQQITEYFGSGGAGIELLCTENNSDAGAEGKQSSSLVNGLYYSDSVCRLMQTEMNGYFWWDLRNGSDTNGSFDPTLYGWRTVGDEGLVGGLIGRYPTFYAAKLLQYLARPGDSILSATSDYPRLSAYSAWHTDGSLALLVLNKDTAADLNAQINLNGFAAGPTATLYSYGIPQDTAARNGAGSQDLAKSSRTGLGSSFSYTFPALSQTLFQFAPAAPSLGVVAAQTGAGQFVIELQGQAGVPWVIQSSTNLVNWVSVSTNTLTANSLNVTNPVAADASPSFWRAVWGP